MTSTISDGSPTQPAFKSPAPHAPILTAGQPREAKRPNSDVKQTQPAVQPPALPANPDRNVNAQGYQPLTVNNCHCSGNSAHTMAGGANPVPTVSQSTDPMRLSSDLPIRIGTRPEASSTRQVKYQHSGPEHSPNEMSQDPPTDASYPQSPDMRGQAALAEEVIGLGAGKPVHKTEGLQPPSTSYYDLCESSLKVARRRKKHTPAAPN